MKPAQQTQVQIHKSVELQQMQPFYNPVCKVTYEALPKIYGTASRTHRKNNIINIKPSARYPPPKHCCMTSLAQQKDKQKNFKKLHYNSLEYKRLSLPKSPICNKQDCTCHKICEENRQSSLGNRKTKLTNRGKKLILPQIQLKQFALDDIQTRHKVLKTQNNDRIIANYSPTGLQSLIQMRRINLMNGNNFKDKIYKQIQQEQSQKCQEDQSSNPQDFVTADKNLYIDEGLRKKMNIKTAKNIKEKYKRQLQFKAQHDSSYVENSEEQSSNKAQFNKISNLQPKKQRYNTQEISEAQSNHSKKSSSISISSFIFKTNKRINTVFHDNNKKQGSFIKSNELKKSVAKSVLSNGLFRIPQEQQYKQYLKKYKPLNSEFKLKKLIKSPNFQIIKDNNSVYFGQVQNDKKQGTGLFIEQKQIFEGTFHEDLKVKGFQRNIDGIYIGQFVNGLRSGHGTFKWNNGQVFQGNWSQGTKNGFGTWKSPKGDYYQGQWLLNRQHGKGKFKHRLSVYQGQFKDFLKSGHGRQKFLNGDTYEGEYKQGKPHGYGKYTWIQGGQYTGDFIKGMRQGKGKWNESSGNSYEGQFFNDFKHGKGKQTFKNGEYFIGQFEQGNKIKGKMYNIDGSIIEIQ